MNFWREAYDNLLVALPVIDFFGARHMCLIALIVFFDVQTAYGNLLGYVNCFFGARHTLICLVSLIDFFGARHMLICSVVLVDFLARDICYFAWLC